MSARTKPLKRSRGDRIDESVVYELRRLYAAGHADPVDENGDPCTLTEFKAELGRAVTPPVSAASVHKLVTGQTYPTAPGPVFPTENTPVEGTASRAFIEVYERVKVDGAEVVRLLARVPAGTGANISTVTRVVEYQKATGAVTATRTPGFGRGRVVDPEPITRGEPVPASAVAVSYPSRPARVVDNGGEK